MASKWFSTAGFNKFHSFSAASLAPTNRWHRKLKFSCLRGGFKILQYRRIQRISFLFSCLPCSDKIFRCFACGVVSKLYGTVDSTIFFPFRLTPLLLQIYGCRCLAHCVVSNSLVSRPRIKITLCQLPCSKLYQNLRKKSYDPASLPSTCYIYC